MVNKESLISMQDRNFHNPPQKLTPPLGRGCKNLSLPLTEFYLQVRTLARPNATAAASPPVIMV